MDSPSIKPIRPLILATANLYNAERGIFQRTPELELGRRFQGTLLGYDDLKAAPAWRKLEQALRLDFSLARRGLSLLNGHNVILSASEKVGIPLLALSRQTAVPHIMLAHHPLSPIKFRLLKASGLLHRLSKLVCLSSEELRLLRQKAGLPAEKVVMIEGVCTDHRFFLPAPGPGEGFVFATGATLRDYPLLMRALGGLAVRVVVAAGSQWVQGPTIKEEIPPNFTFLPKQTLEQMRELYARCAVVAIPLRRGTQHSAGRTNVTEAMASAKAVVATDLPGMRDYIKPGHNGLLFVEGEEAGLREAVATLLSDEKLSRRLGEAGRREAEEKWNLEVYVEFLSHLMSEVVQKSTLV